jgi:hypothetical protein
MTHNQPQCLYCDKDSELTPLISLAYRGETYWICPQHLPILIHKPENLAHKLPGAENLEASAGHNH